MRAAAVVYVGDLERMRAFYQGCFGLALADEGDGYCGLRSEAWLLTLVRSPQAVPATSPPPRRSRTPIKLAFEVDSIAATRSAVAELGGRIAPRGGEWSFRNATHCDCTDPEGNVVQLIEPQPEAAPVE